MLGVDRWRIHDLTFPPVPWDARSTEAKLTVGFGRVAGLTFELIQVREGRTIHLDFLESRGEGVQHVGMWTSDVRAAVEHAVSGGTRVTPSQLEFVGPAGPPGMRAWMGEGVRPHHRSVAAVGGTESPGFARTVKVHPSSAW